MSKELNDVLEYLYKQGKKDMALEVIKAIKYEPTVTYYPPYYLPTEPGKVYFTMNTLGTV